MNARLFLVLCLLFSVGGCSYEKVEREIGHKGPARRDPFLAAQRFLQQRDFTVSNVTRFGSGPDLPGTLVTPAQSFVIHGMTDRVMNWVNRGGHLVVFLRDGEAFRSDWSAFSLRDFQAEDLETQRLFEELGVAAVEAAKSTTAKGEILGREVAFDSPATFTWREGKQPELDFAIGEEDKPAAASFSRGHGHVTIIASAKPFRNRYLGEANNAWTFWLLTAHAETTGIWFLQGVRISFFAMLWEHGWMPVIALLLLVVLWLWRHLPRFGPLRQAPADESRDFASHLGVVGAFQWRHGQAQRLLAPLREAILRAAARRGWAAADDRLPEHLAAATGLPPDRVQQAMQVEPREPQIFLSVVQDLQKIAAALRA